MYPEDSVMCCFFPYKCNMFDLTPEVILWDVMWYLNMTFATCSLIWIVWSILCNLHRYVEKKICKFIHSKRKCVKENVMCQMDVQTMTDNNISVNPSNNSCNPKRFNDASCSSGELIIKTTSLGCKRTEQLDDVSRTSFQATAIGCRSLSNNYSCSKSTNSNVCCRDDNNYDDECECCNIDLQQMNNERYCNLSRNLIDEEIFSTVRSDEFEQIIEKIRKQC